jgi:hypothetical protein
MSHHKDLNLLVEKFKEERNFYLVFSALLSAIIYKMLGYSINDEMYLEKLK